MQAHLLMTLVCEKYSIPAYLTIFIKKSVDLFIFLIFFFKNSSYVIALLELSEPIAFNRHNQPIEITDDCETPHMGGKPVISIGTGRTDRELPCSNFEMRHAEFETIGSEFCTEQTNLGEDPNTLICTFQNDKTGQSIWFGDSGETLYFIQYIFMRIRKILKN